MNTNQGNPIDKINRRLRAVDTRWEAIFNSAPDPIIIGDEEGILVCNPRFEEITGLTSEKIIGIPISSLPMCISDIDDCKNLILHWNNPSQAGGRFNWNFINPKGKRVVLDLQIRFVEIEQNVLRFCIGRDITHEIELLQDQEIAIAQIDKNMAQLAALNDEIRNPLTMIAAWTGLDHPPSHDKIMEGVQRINAIIDRIDTGYVESEKVRKYLQRSIDRYRPDPVEPAPRDP